MARYERGDLTTVTTIANPSLEIRAGADPIYLKELAFFLNAATASTIGLGRPANTVGVAGTVGLGQAVVSDDAASTGGIVLSGQSTVPTAPTVFMRQISLGAVLGAGMIWTWPEPGLRIKQSTSLVLWNITAISALRYYAVWDD